MNRILLMQKAEDFYNAFFEHVRETANVETAVAIQADYFGIAAVGAAFMGYLVEQFYNEPADFRHIFLTTLGSRGTPFGSIGLASGTYKKSEVRDLIQGLVGAFEAKKLDGFFTKDFR